MTTAGGKGPYGATDPAPESTVCRACDLTLYRRIVHGGYEWVDGLGARECPDNPGGPHAPAPERTRCCNRHHAEGCCDGGPGCCPRCPINPAPESGRTREFTSPTEQEVDVWRAALEEAACGSVERVWGRLSVVIAEMRRTLGYDGRQSADCKHLTTDRHDRWCPRCGATISPEKADPGCSYCGGHHSDLAACNLRPEKAECLECFHSLSEHDESGCNMQTGSWETGPVDCGCTRQSVECQHGWSVIEGEGCPESPDCNTPESCESADREAT
jgi:hypothetical protein